MARIEQLNEQEKAALRDMIKRADRSRDVTKFSLMLLEAAKQFRKNPFRFVEEEMRKLDSGLYLVAQPMTPQLRSQYIASMPYTGKQEYPFGLGLLLGTEQGWHARLRVLMVSPQQNSINLDSAGFMGPRPGTRFARSLRFRES